MTLLIRPLPFIVDMGIAILSENHRQDGGSMFPLHSGLGIYFRLVLAWVFLIAAASLERYDAVGRLPDTDTPHTRTMASHTCCFCPSRDYRAGGIPATDSLQRPPQKVSRGGH